MIGSISAGSYYGYSGISGISSSSLESISMTRRAALNGAHPRVNPITSTPEVFSNAETVRPKISADKLASGRENIFAQMNASTTRNAHNINGLFFKENAAEQVSDTDTTENSKNIDPLTGEEECETCKNRKYVDGSDEGNVSFKAPGHISPEASAGVVAAHENMHVRNAVKEGNKEDAELVNVSVSLQTDICPECGKSYVSGGTTTSTIKYSE